MSDIAEALDSLKDNFGYRGCIFIGITDKDITVVLRGELSMAEGSLGLCRAMVDIHTAPERS